MMAMVGTLIAQLFSIQQEDSTFSYARIGKPLAAVCFSFSIVTTILGAVRAWRQQQAMLHGRALSGGPELAAMVVAFLIVSPSAL
jgi:hypothetical protein